MTDIKCSTCQKGFSSWKCLNQHNRKPIPCDFKCKLCDVKSTNITSYKDHQRTTHPDVVKPRKQYTKKIEVKEDELILIKPDIKPDIVPVDDFGDFGDNVKKIMIEIIKMAKTVTQDGSGFEAKVTIDIKVNPVLNAARVFRACDFESSLRCLESPDNATQIAAGVLTQMHSDPERPEMHTIKMKDVSRKHVNIYSRPSKNEQPKWLPYSHSAALRKLSEHAASLLRCALTGSINIMAYKYHAEGKFVCFSLPMPIDGKYIIICDLNDEDETGMLQTNGICLKVDLYDGKLIDIPDDQEYKDRIRELDSHIKAKGTQVLKKLRDIRFTDKDIGAFLERTRRPLTMIENID